jgi:hypothetical protein
VQKEPNDHDSDFYIWSWRECDAHHRNCCDETSGDDDDDNDEVERCPKPHIVSPTPLGGSWEVHKGKILFFVHDCDCDEKVVMEEMCDGSLSLLSEELMKKFDPCVPKASPSVHFLFSPEPHPSFLVQPLPLSSAALSPLFLSL